MFVSATALFPARSVVNMGRVTNLAKRFDEATVYESVNVNSLQPHIFYAILKAKRIPTKYGPSIVLTIRISETRIVQVFLPKHYSEIMSDTDINDINSKAVSLHLVYKGICESTKAYFLANES